MAVQTVVVYVSLVFLSTVISELSHNERNFRLEKVQNGDDEGSGLSATEPLIANDSTDVRNVNISSEDDTADDELFLSAPPAVPTGNDKELEAVDNSNGLYKEAEETTIFPSSEEWLSNGIEGISDLPSRRSDDALTTTLRNSGIQETPSENLTEVEEIDEADLAPYIIDKRGRKYLDISTVNKTGLKLQELMNVYGIVAEDGQNCRIRKLVITANYHVDRNILECHTLNNLTLSGNDWLCGHDWSWLKELERRGIAFHSDALCADLKIPKDRGYGHRSLKFTEGISILHKLGIKDCPEKCRRCLTVLTKEKQFEDHRVHCERGGLTDDDIPLIPTYTTQLFLENNQLKSTQKLFSHLKHLENITAILLGGNMLDSIPHLDEEAFTKLKRLFFPDNNIRKIDVEAFESIIHRKDIVVEVLRNHFPCDCNSHFFLKLCLKYVKKVNNLIKGPLKCVNETSNVRQLMTLRDDCEPKSIDPFDFMPILLIFLAVMNIIIIYLVYDLVMAIRECRGQGSHIRDPQFHRLVVGTQRCLRFVFKKNEKNRREEEREGPPDPVGFRSQNTPVTLRTNRLSSADRDSCMVRTDRRRLTPCPN